MMRHPLRKRTISYVLTILMVAVIMSAATEGQSTGPVPVGEPLHIYLRKDVPQQMLYLHFYPPPGDVPLTETSSRFIIERKGSLNATAVVFFPRDLNSNFLQFEPNGSVEAKYQMMLFAARPVNASDSRARLEMVLELDYQRDNRYDVRVTASIVFEANSSFVKVQGPIPFDMENLKRFDGERGGKVRLTITRSDDLDTIVVLHCGSSESPSFLQLPFSKYRFVPSEDNGGGISPLIVLGVAVALVVVFFIALKLLNREKVGRTPKEDGREVRRKGKRWSRKGNSR